MTAVSNETAWGRPHGRSRQSRFPAFFSAVRPGEALSAVLFCSYAFLLLVCYYILKTLREPLLLVDGSAELKSYAHATIALALVVMVPLYGIAFRRTQACQLIRWITGFFVGNLTIFYVLGQAGLDVGFAYYVWVGAFSVTMLAQFWAHAADAYDVRAGQRLFPIIMAAATLGGLTGPSLVQTLFPLLGPWNLMLIAMGLLATTLPLVAWSHSAVPAASRNAQAAPDTPDRHLFGGFALVLRDRYLLLLAVMVVLLNCVNSIGEYLLAEIVVRHADEQVAGGDGIDKGQFIASFYGNFFFTVNSLTMIVQIFLVGRLFHWIGIRSAVLILPLIALIGYALAAFIPIFSIIRIVKVIENTTDYSVMNTARQALFLPLGPAAKYEGKTAIESFFWRFGDVLQAGVIYGGLHWLDFGYRQFALLNVLLGLAWFAIARQVGRRFAERLPTKAPETAAARQLPLESGMARPLLGIRPWPAIRTGVWACLASGLVLALPAASQAEPGALFRTDEPLHLDFHLDMRSLCRNPARTACDDAPATLIYQSPDNVEQRIEVRMRVRGRWGRQNGHCSFPALFIFFAEESTRGSVFENQEMLPYTTHCQSRQHRYDQYVLKEYLAYRLYNLLTDKSLRVRLVRATYHDSSRKAKPLERYGFFTEHFASLAARHGAEIWKPERFDTRQAEPMDLATLDLFQYMIGNTDWSTLYGHNVMHFRDATGLASAVPFDFDFSGLVDAPYAGPPPKLPLRSVRQRLFRGLCNPRTDWEALFETFQARHSEALALVDRLPGLSISQQRTTKGYLADFFRVLDSAKLRQRKVVSVCRPIADAQLH